MPPWAPHSYDFVVLTSLTHPIKILLVVLQIGKAKDLSAPLLISIHIACLLPVSQSYEMVHFRVTIAKNFFELRGRKLRNRSRKSEQSRVSDKEWTSLESGNP
jgi:hypothetical protein